MTLSLIALIGGYVLTACLLAFLCLYTRFHWSLKAGTTVLVSAFYIINYFGLTSLLGWPTMQDMPNNFRLISAQIYEPNKTTGTPGRIYIWVTSMGENAGLSVPRSFEIEYSDEVHKKVATAMNAIQDGTPQIGEIEEDGAGNVMARTDQAQQALEPVKLNFFDLPTSVLPEK